MYFSVQEVISKHIEMYLDHVCTTTKAAYAFIKIH